MLAQLFGYLENFLTAYGYWALAVTLLLENAGIPLPGETMLMFAGFLAFEHEELDLFPIILVGTVACTLGDNLGYWIGNKGGRRLLLRYQKVFRISDERIASGERLFERFGPVTVFFARFVPGMRIFAGPLAGVLLMRWRRFVLFNFLGAMVWVTAVASAGYLFGQHWQRLLETVSEVNAIVFGLAFVVLAALWWRYRKKAKL